MLVLITNDDGLQAAGINALAQAFAARHEVWVVAPDREQSGSSHKLTLSLPLRIAAGGPQRFAVDGTPTDAVYLAVHHLLPKRPDLLVSGINHGPNLADDVTYSGTVAAAIEATVLDIPAIAVSVAAFENFRFEAAARFTLALAEKSAAEGLPRGTFLNVNVPGDMDPEAWRVRVTRLGKRNYGQFVVRRADPRGRDYFWIGGNALGSEAVAGSDIEAVAQGHISITPLSIDLTDYQALERLRGWELNPNTPPEKDQP